MVVGSATRPAAMWSPAAGTVGGCGEVRTTARREMSWRGLTAGNLRPRAVREGTGVDRTWSAASRETA
jgi:hypothetical protein